MLKQTYLTKLAVTREKYPDAKFVVVTRTARSILAPSVKLLSDYKEAERRLGDRWKAWNLTDYEARYREEIKNSPDALKEIKRIKAISDKKDVYLVCYERNPPCHRFILLDVIEKLKMVEDKRRQ